MRAVACFKYIDFKPAVGSLVAPVLPWSATV
jgi:hypothetical protein